MEWIVQLPILIFSVMIHEVCHGWTAFVNGDKTAERAGRLTLNPISHIDPFGTIFLPMLCYISRIPMLGAAKPVPVNVGRLRKTRRDWMMVAFMGPASNIILAVLAAVLFRCVALLPSNSDFQHTVLSTLIYAVQINLVLAFFNLIPIHPLDGSQVVGALLPPAWRQRYDRLSPYGMVIIVLLMITGALNLLVFRPERFMISILSHIGLLVA